MFLVVVNTMMRNVIRQEPEVQGSMNLVVAGLEKGAKAVSYPTNVPSSSDILGIVQNRKKDCLSALKRDNTSGANTSSCPSTESSNVREIGHKRFVRLWGACRKTLCRMHCMQERSRFTTPYCG